MDRSYIAWIPCVSGELFFSKISHGLGVYDFYLLREQIRSGLDNRFLGRQIVASSVVDWQDTVFFEEPFAGLFRTVVIARSSDYGSISGTIYFIEKNNLDNKSSFKKFLIRSNEPYESALLGCLSEFEQRREVQSLDEYTLDLAGIERNILSISQAAVHAIEFQTYSTGITLLKWKDARVHGKSMTIDEYEQKVLIRQGFYYLKYLLHKHVHHAHSNESLTTVHTFTPDNEANARVLVRDIKRGLVSIKRKDNFMPYSVAGICEYGFSLVTSCRRHGMFDDCGGASNSEAEFSKYLLGPDPKTTEKSQNNYLSNITKSIDLRFPKYRDVLSTSLLEEFRKSYIKTLMPTLALVSPYFLYIVRQSNSDSLQQELETKKDLYCVDRGSSFLNSLYCELSNSALSFMHGSVTAINGAILSFLMLVLIITVLFFPWKKYAITEDVLLRLKTRVQRSSWFTSRLGRWFAICYIWASRVPMYIYNASPNKAGKFIFLVFVILIFVYFSPKIILNVAGLLNI